MTFITNIGSVEQETKFDKTKSSKKIGLMISTLTVLIILIISVTLSNLFSTVFSHTLANNCKLKQNTGFKLINITLSQC